MLSHPDPDDKNTMIINHSNHQDLIACQSIMSLTFKMVIMLHTQTLMIKTP